MSLFTAPNAISNSDILLVNRLSAQSYPDLTMQGVASDADQEHLKTLQSKLMLLATEVQRKYQIEYGPFKAERAKGNPVGRGRQLRRIWSCVFKGSYNKQYAAQVSFVFNTRDSCLDVGFYFGRASAQSREKAEVEQLQQGLRGLGETFSRNIREDDSLMAKFQALFDIGFKAEIRDERVSPERWLNNASTDPQYSSIIIGLRPNSTGYIDRVTIETYVAMVMPLMLALPDIGRIETTGKKRQTLYLTPEQRARQAEIRAMIGLAGEKIVMEFELAELKRKDYLKEGYPEHRALISDSFHYDILTCDADDDLFIEVKTTTRQKGDPYASIFYMSHHEYEFYLSNVRQYRLYRVYDVYGSPVIEEVDLDRITPKTESYKMIISSKTK